MRYNLLLILTLLVVSTKAQIYPDKYFVAFTDKNNSPYSITQPQEFLSQRAIERRLRFNIPVDVHDLPVNPQYIQAVADIGVEIINPTKWLNGVTIYTTDPSKIPQIEALPFVKSVTKARKRTDVHPKLLFDREISLHKPVQLNETIGENFGILKASQKTGNLNYGFGFNQINQINGIPLHEDGFLGQGMIIAVLDAGFSLADQLSAFDSLFLNGRILGTRDFVAGGNYVYHGSYHGTAVLSTMGAYLPGQLIGTAPGASYYLIRTEDTGSEYIIEEYNWASGAEWADSLGADILNTSLGYIQFDDPSQNHEYSDMDGDSTPVTIASDIAASRGMIVVNSAGNSGYSSFWPWIGAPADGDSVFTVGAVDATGNIAGFSSVGPTYDGRLKPNVVAQGAGTTIISPNGSAGTSSGTSFSSPIIAGMTACLWQTNINIPNMSILQAIEISSSHHNSPNYQYGHGIPDYNLARMVLPAPGKNHVKNPGELFLYPNPFSDKINLMYHAPDTQMVRIILINQEGRQIHSFDFQPQKAGIMFYQIDNLSHLPRGFYILQLIHSEGILSEKLIKYQ